MRKKTVKRFLAMFLTVSMMIPSIPLQIKAAESSQDTAEADVFLPEAAYFWDFEDYTDAETTYTSKGAAKGTAELKGTAAVDPDDSTFMDGSNHVLSLKGGEKGSSYVELPSTLYNGFSAETGLTWSFWMKEDANIGSYTRLFSSSNGSKQIEYAPCTKDTNWNLDFGDEYCHSYNTTDDQPPKNVWSYITITVSGNNEIKFYTNGIEVASKAGYKTDVSKVKTYLDNLSDYTANVLGKTTSGWGDRDCIVQLDEIAIYKNVLTAEQVKAAYDLYADYDAIKALIPQVQAKLPVAKTAIEGKSVSFYTKETYHTLQKAIQAIETGAIAVATPATKAQLEKLLSDLSTELAPYGDVTDETSFSNAQLADENVAAKKIISDGGLTSECRENLQNAITAADEALALTEETAENQAVVDAALEALREVVDGLDASSLATPVITQPVKAVYKLGETASPLTVEAKVDVIGDDSRSLTYQWYQNTVKTIEGASAIPGATDTSYTPSTETVGKTYYYCEITNSNPAIAAQNVTNSNVVLIRVNKKEAVNVPKPYYEFTFDEEGDTNTQVTNQGSKPGAVAEIEGNKEGLGIIEDEGRASKVLNLPGGSKEGTVEGRLSLPDNMFADVTDQGFAFSFWINIDEGASQYSRIFSGTVNGQNSDNGWPYEAPEFAFVAGAEGATDLGEKGSGYHSIIFLPDAAKTQLKLVWEEQFAKGRWQHVTISVSPTAYDVYLDGEKVAIKYDRSGKMEEILTSLFADNAAILKQYVDCSIGASVYKTDKDLKAKVDEFRFYNEYLNIEQAEAAYDSYAVDKKIVAALKAKVDEAKALNASVSFYTRETYEALIAAIAAGEEGVENPVTKEYVTGLTTSLSDAIEHLTLYDGVSEDDVFSKVQLGDEKEAADALIAAGGLTPDSEEAISTAIESAATALSLEAEEANAQEIVDAALVGLRAAVDAVEYEDAAATPVIDNEGQPQAATYTKDDTSVVVAPLTVTATVSDKGTLTYQWYQNTTNSTTGGSKIEGEGANTASYTPVVGDVGTTYYYCEVTNTQEKAVTTRTATAKSNVAAVTVKEVETPKITGQSPSTTYQLGSETKPSLKVVVAAVSEGTLSYQWYQNTSNSTTGGTAIANATEASYTPNISEAGTTYYYCVVTNTIGTAKKTAISNVISIKAAEDLSQVAADPSITTQPQGAEYTTSDTAQPLTVEATVEGEEEPTLIYQWYKSATNSTEDGTAIPGETDKSYTPNISEAGTTYYYCVVLNRKGEAVGTAVSEVAAIIVTQAIVTPEPEAATPSITTQPKGAAYTYGKTAKALSVAASVSDEGTLSYQWYRNTSNSTEGGTAINGATAAAYTPAVTAVGTVYYYCVVTNTKDAKTAETTSSIAAIKVNKAASSITGVSNVTTTFGKSVTLKAKGKGTVTYTSSNTKVLTIGKTNGKIKIVGYGNAQVTIKAAGDKNYNGATKKITVTVKPKKMTVSSVKSTKKKTLTVKWKKDAKADGYKIQYSTDKKFKKDVKTTTVKGSKKVKTTLKKLKAGKKYYVRIRAYKGSGKNQVSGDWSAAKNAKVKK